MVLNKYINENKEYLLKILKYCTDNKLKIYLPFFIFYLLFYYLITIPETISQINSAYLDYFIKNYFIILIIVVFILNIFFIFITVIIIKKYSFVNEFIAIMVPIILSGIILFLDVFTLSKYLKILLDYKTIFSIIKLIFIIISYIFFILFFSLFIYDIKNEFNIEFFISLEIIMIILFVNFIRSNVNLGVIYFLLKNNDYSLLSIECFNQNNNNSLLSIEYFNQNNNNSNQITNINSEYGDTYLKTIGDIPISFYNNILDNYQDLVLADFYYPGSYYSYLPDSPLNGTPSLEALKIIITKFKCRLIHLDIFSNNNIDDYDPNVLPIVKCKNMKNGATPLNFEDTLSVINKWGWDSETSYPLFLYLNFNFKEDNISLYEKIYNSLLKFFSKYFIDKKYSFAGRNHTFPLSMAKIKECLGKIIIITNIYPTKSVLDELINDSTNELNSSFQIKEYKEDYIKFDGMGLSQDNDKTALVNNSKTNISFYYTEPNDSYKNNNQPKAGLFNPSFQDCAQYGIQGTLMYVFTPDDNLNKWNLFFKNKNNLNPVLKDQSLRSVSQIENIINEQNPTIGLQKSQKYCLIPDLMSTEKSNLSTGSVNGSC